MRPVEDEVLRALLDDHAVMHHDHPVSNLLDHALVAIDAQAGKSVAVLQIRDQVENLRAH
ncbi:hypothetical protein ACUSIJ_14975 [Pseudochelatococcus sp. B33]